MDWSCVIIKIMWLTLKTEYELITGFRHDQPKKWLYLDCVKVRNVLFHAVPFDFYDFGFKFKKDGNHQHFMGERTAKLYLKKKRANFLFAPNQQIWTCKGWIDLELVCLWFGFIFSWICSCLCFLQQCVHNQANLCLNSQHLANFIISISNGNVKFL